jgi:hypothetical protein
LLPSFRKGGPISRAPHVRQPSRGAAPTLSQFGRGQERGQLIRGYVIHGNTSINLGGTERQRPARSFGHGRRRFLLRVIQVELDLPSEGAALSAPVEN